MQEEIALLNRARAFDQDALAEIHDSYYDAVYRYISFRISDHQSVEDMTSEVFVRFLKAINDRNAPQNTIRGWLFGTASRVVKEYYRRNGRASWTLLDESIPAKGNDPAHLAETNFEKQQLRQAITHLTDEQQHVLALRFGYGLPIREVAALLNKSEGSIKMLQARAVAALGNYLSGLELGQ